MEKLINGILEFQKNLKPSDRENFAKLALGQSPDALFVGCSDSRVAVNVFASTNPGDLFVVRNVGNLVPPCEVNGTAAIESEAAAIEFAIGNLNVTNIIICGHSECGAMQALTNGRDKLKDNHLKNWLQYGEGSLKLLKTNTKIDNSLKNYNRLSQINVLKQIEHLKTYPIIQAKLKAKQLKIHGWWFELSTAAVFAYDESEEKFMQFDETQAAKMRAK